MKITHRQTEVGFCGLYALANVLNDDSFMNFKESYDSSHDGGLRLHDLNILLHENKYNYHIVPIFIDLINHKLPDNFDLKPTHDEIIPLLSAVKPSETSKFWHMIGIRTYFDGTIRIFDSLSEETVVTTWDELNKMYHKTEGVYAFCFNDNSIEGYVCLQ